MTFTVLGFLIAVAPLLVLLAFLVGDRYPGERTLERARRLINRLFLAGSVGDASSPVRTVSRAVRGGRLIACSLAGRGPPRST